MSELEMEVQKDIGKENQEDYDSLKKEMASLRKVLEDFFSYKQTFEKRLDSLEKKMGSHKKRLSTIEKRIHSILGIFEPAFEYALFETCIYKNIEHLLYCTSSVVSY